MKISSITGHTLSSTIEPPREFEFQGGSRKILKRDVVLVTVETASGEIGYAPAGSASSAMRKYFANASYGNFAGVINDIVAPTLRGMTVTGPADVHEVLDEINIPEFLRSQAIGAIDVALYDIKGKRQGAPIYELLLDESEIATKPEQTLPLYASGGMYTEPKECVEEARALVDYGFSGYKYRPGLGPEKDRRTLEAVHEAVGEDIEIMVDAHTWWKMGEESYSFDQVTDVVSDFVEYGVHWVEEPVEPAAHDEYRRLHGLTGAPLAGGESEESPAALKDLAATGAVDSLQGNVRHHRGFTGCWDVVEYCQNLDVTFVPHHFGTQLGLVANAHLLAAAPETELLQYPVFENGDHPGMYPFPLAEDILKSPLDTSNGEITVPDEPGLGVTVNPKVLDEYQYEEGQWTEFDFGEGTV